ncbi:DUF4349 domain-containing protein [Paludicola sp. MB14-C6]|uniref:DUF4349 domain-containing protein n=1 Tax=Paludihabitans sp. MB14-C6 TaxID=3070656 RepID=UPI0027DBAC8E|nr:DUF4349 domain-containing protein [Paludicola sp. MB14-C6]WMJ24118.1 DUF4349 domain-containing protein [Paludicola sp. MB14-C6]
MKRLFTILVSIVLITAFLLTGCQRSDKHDAPGYSQNKTANSVNKAEQDSVIAQDGVSTAKDNKITVPETNRKLIRNVSLTIQTKEFDKLNTAISQKIYQSSGYVESSEVFGNSKLSNSSRNCNMVIRIPKTKLDEFISTISGLGTVISKQETTQDITLNYIDVDSHKKALQVEQDRLLALLEKANKLEDIIALEQRLSQVRYEIQTYESQLRTYDNQVDYSTVQLSINEVERVTQKDDGTMWSKIATGFSNNLHKIGYGLEAFFIWLLSNIIFIILFAGVVTLAILWIKRIVKKRKHLPAASEEAKIPPQK